MFAPELKSNATQSISAALTGQFSDITARVDLSNRSCAVTPEKNLQRRNMLLIMNQVAKRFIRSVPEHDVVYDPVETSQPDIIDQASQPDIIDQAEGPMHMTGEGVALEGVAQLLRRVTHS